MRLFNFLLLCFFLNISFAQDEIFQVPFQDSYYSYISNVELEKDIVLLRNNGIASFLEIDFIEKSTGQFHDLIVEEMKPVDYRKNIGIFPSEDINMIFLLSMIDNGDGLFLEAYSIDLVSKKLSLVSKIYIAEHIELDYWMSINSNKSFYKGKSYLIINELVTGEYFANRFFLVSLGINGELKLLAISSSADQSNRLIRIIKRVNTLNVVNENSFILTGDSPVMVAVDNMLNIVDGNLYSTSPDYSIVRGKLLLNADSSFVSIGVGFVKDEPAGVVVLKGSFKTSYHVDSWQIINTVDFQAMTYDIAVDNSVLNTYYIGSTELTAFETSNFRKNPNTLKLSKLEDHDILWEQEYGKEFNYVLQSIKHLNTGQLLLLGDVLNYYDEGNVNGFYLLVNPENGDVISSTFDLSETLGTLELYPNPSSQEISFKTDVEIPRDSRVIVFDLMGELVLDVPYKELIDIHYLRAGEYFVAIKNKEKFIFPFRKMIKQ